MDALYDSPGLPRKPPKKWLDPHAFVMVPRSLLALGELWLTDAVFLAHIHYRAARRHDVDAAELAALSGHHRVSCWRALERLRKAGWLGDDGRPAKQLPVGKRGALKVHFSDMRQLGSAEACVLGQLRSLETMRVAQTNQLGHRAPTGMLARMLGACRDAVRDCLKRLASGDTVRSRLAARRGLGGQRTPVIALAVGFKTASRIRVTSNAQLQLQRVQAAQHAKPAAHTHVPDEDWFATHDALLRRKAAAPP